jgi:hypothetical protein
MWHSNKWNDWGAGKALTCWISKLLLILELSVKK